MSRQGQKQSFLTDKFRFCHVRNVNPNTQTYLGHPFTVLGLQAFLGLLKVRMFAVIPGRFEVPIHSVWRTGSHCGHWRGTEREKSNIGKGRHGYEVQQSDSEYNKNKSYEDAFEVNAGKHRF